MTPDLRYDSGGGTSKKWEDPRWDGKIIDGMGKQTDCTITLILNTLLPLSTLRSLPKLISPGPEPLKLTLDTERATARAHQAP